MNRTDYLSVAVFALGLLFVAIRLVRLVLSLWKLQAELPDWKVGLCGTAMILGAISLLTLPGLFVAAALQVGPAVLPLFIVGILFAPTALLLSLASRSQLGYSIAVAEGCQLLLWMLFWVWIPKAIL